MANASQTRLSAVAESVPGTTPATPAFQNLRFTSESFNPALRHVTSNEIRPDRNVADLILVGAEAAGEFGFELSYGSFDELLESVFQSTWNTDVLENGITPKSFTIEKTFETGATDQFHRYRGCMANTFSLNCRAGEIVTGNMGFLAKDMVSAQAPVAGATYADPNTNPVINAANHFANLAITGVTAPQITSLSLSVTNNLRQQPVIGSIFSKGVGAGRFVVTGEIEAYFENADLFETYLNDEYTDLSFRLGGLSALAYDFLLPKIKLSGGEVVTGGNDQDVMGRFQFQAIYDATEGTTLQITRDPS